MSQLPDPFHGNPSFIGRFRDGELDALEQVYRTFERPLRRFLQRGFGFQSKTRHLHFSGRISEADLEDLIQETFRRAFGDRARAAYDGVRPYRNYLFTIAKNVLVTTLQQNNRHVPVGTVLTGGEASAEELTKEERQATHEISRQAMEQPESRLESKVEDSEVYGLVESYLVSLSEEERRFFRCRFLSRESQEKTAQHLGLNRARVRKLETRLRQAFVAHLVGSGYLEGRVRPSARRRVDLNARSQVLRKAREIWRGISVIDEPEFLTEAA